MAYVVVLCFFFGQFDLEDKNVTNGTNITDGQNVTDGTNATDDNKSQDRGWSGGGCIEIGPLVFLLGSSTD